LVRRSRSTQRRSASPGITNFDIDVLATYRPQGKGRVERQVLLVRDHVLSGRAFSSLEEIDAAFAAWVPRRRDQIHKTYREVIGIRATRDHAALKPLPPTPYLLAERYLRPVSKNCLVAFGRSMTAPDSYSRHQPQSSGEITCTPTWRPARRVRGASA
jgi:hypothetical protein